MRSSVPRFEYIHKITGIPYEDIAREFNLYEINGAPPEPSEFAKVFRKLSADALRIIGPKGKHLSTIIKRTKSLNKNIPHVKDLKLASLAAGKNINSPGSVVLTHDIDWDTCYEYLPEIVKMENSYGFRSTVNILTQWWYKPDVNYLKHLQSDGFEIGLHGRTHDIGLGYRSSSKIKKELSKALDEMPLDIRGFRSPALSVSKELFQVLLDLGFVYDSSLLVLNRSRRGCPFVWPFVTNGIMELPLTMQDDMLFRDTKMSIEQAVATTIERMDETLSVGGVFVLNTHPGILKDHLNYYSQLLNYIKTMNIEATTAYSALQTRGLVV
jgi:peptidoglycan/xylan/chitin deacetylase (PgdA/CDA1 family)